MTLVKQRRRLRKSVKKLIFSALRRTPKLRAAFRAMLYARRARIYRSICSRVPVDSRVVIFECFAGRTYSDSPRAIYETMLADERFRDYTFIWAFRPRVTRALEARGGFRVNRSVTSPNGGPLADKIERLFGAKALEQLKRATIVSYASPEYYEWHARAGHWVANYIVPTHMHVRREQKYVQTWHGTPLKRLGCDIEHDKRNAMYAVDDIHARYSREGERLTHLISPSRYASEKLGTAFNLLSTGREDTILEIGYPRNDLLTSFTEEYVQETKSRLGIPLNKRVVLYAPTFRDDQHEAGVGYTLESAVDFDLLRDQLAEDHVILFRPHYLIANRFNFDAYEGFVYDVSATKDINDLFVISDMLVTDYSSVVFDYANLKRPMVFYMYDLESYAEQLRGFYLDISELPGPIVRVPDELVAQIVQMRTFSADDDQKYREFCERFTYLDDGKAGIRAVDRIFLGR